MNALQYQAMHGGIRPGQFNYGPTGQIASTNIMQGQNPYTIGAPNPNGMGLPGGVSQYGGNGQPYIGGYGPRTMNGVAPPPPPKPYNPASAPVTQQSPLQQAMFGTQIPGLANYFSGLSLANAQAGSAGGGGSGGQQPGAPAIANQGFASTNPSQFTYTTPAGTTNYNNPGAGNGPIQSSGGYSQPPAVYPPAGGGMTPGGGMRITPGGGGQNGTTPPLGTPMNPFPQNYYKG